MTPNRTRRGRGREEQKSLGFGSSFLNSLRNERTSERKNSALGQVDFLQLVGSSSLNVRNGYHGTGGRPPPTTTRRSCVLQPPYRERWQSSKFENVNGQDLKANLKQLLDKDSKKLSIATFSLAKPWLCRVLPTCPVTLFSPNIYAASVADTATI